MKYIRTKDGRIVAIPNKSKLVPCDNEKLIIDITKRGQTCIYGIVEKQADTIEELCDEFIVISDNCERPIISALPYNELKLYAKGRTEYAICYGAIWTDKGLIFVAKINDKGELELL